MQLFDNLINVITPSGVTYSHGDINDSKLYHVDALEEFVTMYPEFNLEDDFYERINSIVFEGNIMFLNTSCNEFRQGFIFLPYEVTKSQVDVVHEFDFSNSNINVTKDSYEYGYTFDFNIDDYMRDLKR